jgi:hypothetical protein
MSRVPVTVLITIGDQAELVIPSHKRGNDNPLRVPTADITNAIGIAEANLPGKKLTAIVTETPEDGMTVTGYQLAG